ncbi:unnamed protein product [Symbiodinium natans]|uniref:Uncharacterized protein n=1 Tax=Symbiodinium natans TaxID=878477 RepID=A0A812H432_9DINO|nr:unnamed protein product [Symbiodinium natans]
MALKDPGVVSEDASDSAGMDDPLKCIDDDTSTSLLLSPGQYIIVKVRPGVLVGSFGFKTPGGQETHGTDPVDFQLEGSMDGADWFLLNAKAGYATPDERGILVGPFIVSRMSAMALLGNRTLPAAATAVPASPAPPPSDSKPFEVPQQADQATAPAAVPIVVPVAAAASESTTTTLDIVEAAPEEAQSKVAQAVMQASKANGLDNADTAATAAAVSAASEAAKASTPAAQADSLSKVAEAAASMGLSDAQVASISSALRSTDPDHWGHILDAWKAAASANAASKPTASPEAKVAAVVAATGDAGFTVQQQAVAAAESAVPAALKVLQGATTAAPVSVVGQALAGADIPLDHKAAIVDAASAETQENQKAVADVLSAAGLLSTTTEQPEAVDLGDPNVRLVMDAVSQKLADVPVSKAQKARIVNAAAQALTKASTTPFDGVGMVVEAAKEAGLTDSQVSKIAAEAPELSAEQQVSVATALSAAGDGVEKVMEKTLPKPAEKVAAVVKAEAAAGMDDAEQANSAAIAVAAAASASKRVESAESEADIFKEIVAAAVKARLGQEQIESILSVVAPMPAEDQVAVKEHLEALDPVPLDATSLPPVPLEGLPAVEITPFLPQNDVGRMPSTSTVPEATSSGSGDQFMFGVVPSLTSSRASYKDQTGLLPKGFLFQVVLNSQGILEFLREKTGWEGDPHELSIALGRFRFDWPVTSCSDEESGFTDFQSLTFYNATFANPGDECGTLVATTVDVAGAVRFPRAGDTNLFWLAGQFGTRYPLLGGDKVLLAVLDLVVVAFTGGEKVAYSICGDPANAFYVGCPIQSMLKIKYPENNLGQGVKICSGQAHFHEHKLENCFTAARPAQAVSSFDLLLRLSIQLALGLTSPCEDVGADMDWLQWRCGHVSRSKKVCLKPPLLQRPAPESLVSRFAHLCGRQQRAHYKATDQRRCLAGETCVTLHGDVPPPPAHADPISDKRV